MRNLSRNLAAVASIALGTLAAGGMAWAGNLEGRWAATTAQNGVTIPFRLEISGEGN